VTQLVLVRHGRTAANAAGLLLGRLDLDLDPVGERQAVALADAVRATSEPIAAVVASPLRRTVRTAEALGMDVTVDERFVEVDYGDWDGRPLAEIPAATWAAWRGDPHFRPEGGESLVQVEHRVAEACRDWIERTPEGCVVIATHVSPLKAALSWSLGADVTWSTHVDPASITRIDVRDGRTTLRSFNETGHLAGIAG